jgi:cyclopropane-fatty-acyl-phospholipid synthase
MGAHLDLVEQAQHSEAPWTRWARQRLSERFARAGITLDGDKPWDPQILRPGAVMRAVVGGTLGAGEGYVDGDWECGALDEFTARLVSAESGHPLMWGAVSVADEWIGRITNWQTPNRARHDITHHYDIGNDLYTAMLGPTMAYSCGYWADASTLDDAQRAKYALICHKLGLRPGLRLLEIGCGWGGFARYAAEHYGVEVVGITISDAQAEWARLHCAGLPVEIRIQDYREVDERFDRVVSVGMIEHVGPHNYASFFGTVALVTKPDGLFLLHTIGNPQSVQAGDPWMTRYIFPNAVLPSAAQLTHAFEGRFVLEDWHSFGADYDRTLMAWHQNFDQAWPQLADRYPPRFRRLWRYYLLTCAGLFRARRDQVWQLVLSRSGVAGGYRRVSA